MLQISNSKLRQFIENMRDKVIFSGESSFRKFLSGNGSIIENNQNIKLITPIPSRSFVRSRGSKS